MKLTDNASNQVDIQVVERAGKVQVTVRAADQELTKSIQTNLGDLVERLEEKGYKSETWIPGGPIHASAIMTESSSSRNHTQDQPEHSGSWGGQQQQQQEQQESDRRQQARWINQLEETLDPGDASTESIRMEDR